MTNAITRLRSGESSGRSEGFLGRLCETEEGPQVKHKHCDPRPVTHSVPLACPMMIPQAYILHKGIGKSFSTTPYPKNVIVDVYTQERNSTVLELSRATSR